MKLDKKNILTARERLFCHLYVKEGKNRGSFCAVEAGYSKATAKQIACNLLKKEKIQKYINKLLEGVREKEEWKVVDLINEFKAIYKKGMEGNAIFHEGRRVGSKFDPQHASVPLKEIGQLLGYYKEEQQNNTVNNIDKVLNFFDVKELK